MKLGAAGGPSHSVCLSVCYLSELLVQFVGVQLRGRQDVLVLRQVEHLDVLLAAGRRRRVLLLVCGVLAGLLPDKNTLLINHFFGALHSLCHLLKNPLLFCFFLVITSHYVIDFKDMEKNSKMFKCIFFLI